MRARKVINVAHLDPAKASQYFAELMNSITLTEKDFFRPGCTTILNSDMAAMKRCYELIREMKKKGKKLFEDPDFGPQSPGDAALGSICEDEENPPFWITDPDCLTWLRPKEISKGERTYFLEDGAETGDVLQGDLGDCWFIGAMSVLATKDMYIRGEFNPTADKIEVINDQEVYGMKIGVYPPMFHWLRKYGLYVLRFFKNYAWRYVIIDDRIPCYRYEDQSTRIVFARCRSPTEMWVPLIEKAYAKIHNTYEALISGYLDDGLNDMTGLASVKTKIADLIGDGTDREKIDRLWNNLKRYIEEGCLMGCSIQAGRGETEHELVIDGERMGVLKGHAYSIIDVFELPAHESQNYHKSHRLLRIRNPWGNKEWRGKWSEESDKLSLNAHK